MSTKQVTITVTQSIRQVDKSGKIKETSQTTYEVMKPVDGLMDAPDSMPQWGVHPRPHEDCILDFWTALVKMSGTKEVKSRDDLNEEVHRSCD